MVEKKDILYTQIGELKRWFDFEYSYKEQKFRRLNTLQLKTDEGTDPYIELINLYQEAEINRRKLQELENSLNSL